MATALAGCVTAAALTSFVPESGAARVSAFTGPDARLLELGAEFDKAYAAWVPLCLEVQRLARIYSEKLSSARGPKPTWDEDPASVANEISNDALDICNDISNLIREIPARTIAGLAVKARLVLFDSFSPWDFTMSLEDMDWGPKVFYQFMQEIDRLAAANVFELQHRVLAAHRV